MTRQRARLALGTPLVADAFHANRWDCVHHGVQSPGTHARTGVTVYFVDDGWRAGEGDEMPPPPAQVARAGRRDAVLDKSLATTRRRPARTRLSAFFRKLGWLEKQPPGRSASRSRAMVDAAGPDADRGDPGRRTLKLARRWRWLAARCWVTMSAGLWTSHRRGDRFSPCRRTREADVLIDFTRPTATVAHVNACAGAGVGAVVGTTGLSEADKKALAEAGRAIPLVYAPNMSVGVNVLLKLVALAAQRLGGDYDVEIVEMHHRHKVDAPSGTALQLGEAAAAAMGRDLKTDGVFARDGVIGERKPGAIGFAALRGGDVIGDHTVIFAGPGERVELAHKASSRTTFAHGALRAARFVAAQRAANAPGLYDMRDVLGLD